MLFFIPLGYHLMPPTPRRRLVHIPHHEHVYATRRSLRLRHVLPVPDFFIIKEIKGKHYRIPVYGYYFPLKLYKGRRRTPVDNDA